MAKEQFKNLTEPMFYILLTLQKDNHGYGIMQSIEEVTEGRVSVGSGTLYTLLGKFETDNVIEIVEVKDRKKIYRITDVGKEILKEELKRLKNMIQDYNKFTE